MCPLSKKRPAFPVVNDFDVLVVVRLISDLEAGAGSLELHSTMDSVLPLAGFANGKADVGGNLKGF